MKPDKKTPTPKKTDGKIFDVSRPGKAPASPSSRPVILGHKVAAQQAQASVSGVGEARPLLTKSKVQIFPTSGDKQDEKESAPKPTTDDKKPEADVSTTKTQATPEEQEALAATALEAANIGPPGYMDENSHERLHTGPKLKIEPLQATTEDTDVDIEAAPAEAQPEAKISEQHKPDESTPAETKSEETPPEEPKSAEDDQAKTEIDGEKLPLQMSSMPDEPAPAVPVEAAATSEEDAAEESGADIKPLFDDSGVVVSSHEHFHHHSGLRVFLLILLIIVLAAAALDLILDLGLLKLEGFPHTDFL